MKSHIRYLLAVFAGTAFTAHAASPLSNDLKGFTGTTDDAGTVSALTTAGFSPGETATTGRRISFGPNGATFGSGTGGDNGRNTLRTIEADYHTTSFVSEVLFTTNSEQQALFIGMGAGVPGGYGLPDWGTPANTVSAIYDRRRNPDDFQIRTNSVDVTALRPIFGNGTHRAIFTWDHATSTATFEYDLQNNGSIEGTQSYDASALIADWNGAEESRLYIGGDDGIVVHDWTVTGPVAADPDLVGPAGIDVASNDATTVRTIDVVVENAGATLGLDITGIQVTGPDAGLFTVLTAATPESPLSITTGGNATIQLSLDAGGSAVDTDATLEITSNDSATPVTSIPISGAIRDPWIDSVTSVTGPVGAVDAPTQFDVTINNLGATNDLVVDGAFTTGTDGTYFTVVTDFSSPLIIGAGDSATVTFKFDPAGEIREFSANLEFDSDDIIQPARIVPVTAELKNPPPPVLSLRLTGNSFSGNGTGLIPTAGAPNPNDRYDNSAVPPSGWANIYFDSDGDQSFTSPGDTSGNTNASLEPNVLVSGSGPQTLDFYVQSFAAKVDANFAANAMGFTGLEMTLSDGSVVPLAVTTASPQKFADPGGDQWTVTLAGVGAVGDVVTNTDSVPGGGPDYHFTLTFTLGAANSFDSWATSFGIPADWNDDGDRDGVPALVEYGLGYDPTAFDSLPVPQPSGADFTVTWPKGAQAASDPEISYLIEISSNLETWSAPDPGDLTESPTEFVLTLSGDRAFGRISVTRTP